MNTVHREKERHFWVESSQTQDANAHREACKLKEKPYTQHAGGPEGTFESANHLPLLKNMEAIWPISTLSVISKILGEPRLSAS